MKYIGSKNRHAKEMLSIILDGRGKYQWYVEPFVGGFNMMDKVEGLRMASDSHAYLIELFRAIQAGWVPPTCVSEEEYSSIKTRPNLYPPALVGFVGFGCSYAGKWFGGYARGKGRNYCDESARNLLKQAPLIKDVLVLHRKYNELSIPYNSIVYCDPPYAHATKYKDDFDHEVFWEWVRNQASDGHSVFVSEYEAPSDFISVWSKRVNSSLTQDTGNKRAVEQLWRLP